MLRMLEPNLLARALKSKTAQIVLDRRVKIYPAM